MQPHPLAQIFLNKIDRFERNFGKIKILHPQKHLISTAITDIINQVQSAQAISSKLRLKDSRLHEKVRI